MANEIVNPISELIERLNYHCATADPARMLDGFRLLPKPIREIEGQKDFPFITVFIPEIIGNYRPTRGEDCEITLNVGVSVSTEVGIVGLVTAVKKVLNAIETSTDGRNQVDTSLGNSIKLPFNWRMTQNFVLDISLNANITIPMKPLLGTRGLR